MPLFSIIAPVYNVEKYLDRCINSVLSQTYSDFEFILVDDGSTDASGSICDEYARKDQRICVFHKPNEGVSSARNLGLKQAQGEWIVFVDSDDTLEHDALYVISSIIISKKSFDLLVFNTHTILPSGELLSSDNNLNEERFFDEISLHDQLLPYACRSSSFVNPLWNKVYNKSVIDKNMLCFSSRVRGEDWLFNIQYLQCVGSIMSIKAYLYNYFIHEGSAMTKYVPEQFILWEENWSIKNELIKNYGLFVDSKEMRREMLVKIYYFTKDIIRQEESAEANKKLKYISGSRLLKDSLSVIPNSLHGLKALVYMLFISIVHRN